MQRASRFRSILAWLLIAAGPAAQASLPETVQSLEFRLPEGPARLWRAERSGIERLWPDAEAWIELRTPGGTRRARAGKRVAVQLAADGRWPEGLMRAYRLVVRRRTAEAQWVVEAPDPWTALEATSALANAREVASVQPVLRRDLRLHGNYVPRPNDPHFREQWHLENRDFEGQPVGPDLNPRAAWGTTRGSGVTVAICDDGFETTHPDLQTAAAGGPHFDFTTSRASSGVYGAHSTAVAGLVGASGGNGIGVTGVAPSARLASWAIFDSFSFIVSDERLGDMFQYRLEDVAVRNHSWGNADVTLSEPSLLEATAISNAVSLGRGGRGVLMVRSAGNGRETGTDANADGYANDPRVIAVAATRDDGRVTSYSNPGACLLVASLSGDEEDTFAPTRTVYTTDRVGARGYNVTSGGSDLADYAFGSSGFSGTSASAPMISGLVALIVGANPELTYRDVQQVLIHASRHRDLRDPDVRTNAAGYLVSHNQGFGIPDAGQAVRLARGWNQRPPLVTATAAWSGRISPPDSGLRARIWGGDGASTDLVTAPTTGVHPSTPTARRPLTYVGLATNAVGEDLRGRAALIERGVSYFRDKLNRVAAAGAEFAVIFNHQDGNAVFIPGGTDFVGIPAVMIGENDGRALLARWQAGENVEAQLALDSVSAELVVTNGLLCEHVGLRVRSNHARRGDLRLELISPTGTRSILQRLNDDDEAGPVDWSYWSTQHFYEPARGTWTVVVSDQRARNVGDITGLELTVRGIAIEDADDDGLSDEWERRWFGTLASRAGEDPDGDGSPNAREQVLGTNPTSPDEPLRLELAPYDPDGGMRLTWPSPPGVPYRVLRFESVTDPGVELGRVTGTYPESEWITPRGPEGHRFYRLEVLPR